MNPRPSHVKSHIQIPGDKWMISILAKTKNILDVVGHSMLLVEGVRKRPNSIIIEEFIGQYDIEVESKTCGINPKGRIKVRIFDGKNWDPTKINYKKYYSRSWLVTPEQAEDMITSIYNDAAQYEEAKKGEDIFLRYQLFGSRGLLSELGKGENCTGWCINKLKIAGINALDNHPTKPKKVVGSLARR